MLTADDIAALLEARHGDPFAVLGMHTDADGRLRLSAFFPGATEVVCVDSADGRDVVALDCLHADGFYEGIIPRKREAFAYRYRVTWHNGTVSELDDAYRFPPILGETDAWLLAEGTHLRPF